MVTDTRVCRSRSSGPQTSASVRKSLQARDTAKPPYLLDCWQTVGQRIRAADQIVLFLDFDGTLVRLRRRPREVFLGERARRVLRKLVRHGRVRVCLISGRQLDDLQQRTGVKGAIYFGLHGWERNNGQAPDMPAAHRLRKEMKSIQQEVAGLPGIRIEDKGICFGVHYRTAPKLAVQKARVLVKELLKRLGPDFSLMSGKKVWEIYPKDMGSKGKAARELLRRLPGRKLAIYAGDDTTDETAFALLPNGITIRVGRFQETRAKYLLRNPTEVLMFLEKLEEALT